MAEIHKCGQGWAYCDGNCTTCAVNNCYTTNGTITLVKDYPPYLDYPKQRKKQTNADKYFRNATDEELAKIIVRAKYFDKFCEIVLAGENPGFCDDDCNECALKWLKQEVESDE